jgi:hypothetical protein
VELVPKFVKVAKFLSNMIPARQRRLSHLLRNSPRANANVAGMAVLVDADIQPGDDGWLEVFTDTLEGLVRWRVDVSMM